jgi:hypothetical protein
VGRKACKCPIEGADRRAGRSDDDNIVLHVVTPFGTRLDGVGNSPGYRQARMRRQSAAYGRILGMWALPCQLEGLPVRSASIAREERPADAATIPASSPPSWIVMSLTQWQAAVEGRLLCGIGVKRLRDAPAEWSRQYAMLGLAT